MLKSGAIRFDPPLPEGHQQAIKALGFGRFEKLVLRFDTAFWDDVDQIQVARPAGAAVQWVVQPQPGGRAARADGDQRRGGGRHRRHAAGPADRAGDRAAIYPGCFRQPVAAQASGWWADEFSRGSYSFTAVGSGPQDREELAEPVGGRLWLAGEAVHPGCTPRCTGRG